MKRKDILLFLYFISAKFFSQIIFQEKFNSLALTTHTTTYSTTQYTTLPNGFIDFSEGYKNNPGSSLHPNAPFHTDSLKFKGWGVLYNPTLKDTFLVSTSWVDTNKVTSRWLLLPVINGISINSVLHWKAMAPDPNYADGYAVYISTNTTTTDTTIFNNSNKVFQINDNSTSGGGEKQNWTLRSISLANYSGQSIRVAFKNISKQKYQLWIDDIMVQNLPYAYDAAIENIGNVKYVWINQPFTLKAKIINQGYQNISNINLAYSIQSITYNNQSFALNSDLLPLNSSTVAFTNTININTAGLYKIKIWINQINGQPDQNPYNDTVSYYLSVLNNTITPKILVEQLTDAYLPDAPANQDTLQSITQQDTNILVVQIHQNDSLKISNSYLFPQLFKFPENALPAMINRNYSNDVSRNYFYRNELRSYILKQKNVVSPCKINISNINADTIARSIQCNVSIEFFQNAIGDYRVGIYLIENNVCGNVSDTSLNGYNQLSSFYFTPYSNYYQQGYYLSSADAFLLNAYQYKHHYVLNQAPVGIYGDATVIPNNPIANNVYSQSYTLSIPTSSSAFKNNFDNFYLVAFVYEHDTLIENRNILNADKRKVTNNPELVSVAQNTLPDDIKIFPNPASQYIFVNVPFNKFQGIIWNTLGQQMLSFQSPLIDISSLPQGVYILSILSDSQVYSKRIIIQR
ncbi:MAG: hypothetical protein KatS3mg027_0173 [Bacteroidia bacterium]|nr:MAG: hypothetical protein KatS3mg027_0173 [Bacteroidia bacterium]